MRACQAGSWTVYLRKGRRRWAVRYRCRSWRHAGDCREWRSHENYARLAGPLARLDDHRSVLLLVLTFDQKRVERGLAMVALGEALARAAGAYVDPPAADPRYLVFGVLWRRWQSMRQALHREAERRGERRARWALTVEVHRSGWPHCNVLVEWPWLAAELRADDKRHGCRRILQPQKACGADGCVRDWLSRHAEACGFGRVLYAEAARDRDRVASYMLKVAGGVEDAGTLAATSSKAGNVDALTAETVKWSQVPVNAPPRFRRLRSSLRSKVAGVEPMLDPPHHDPEIAGALVWQRVELVDQAVAADLDLVPDPETGELVSFVDARGPPPGWLERELARLRRHRELDHAERVQWFRDNAPELLDR